MSKWIWVAVIVVVIVLGLWYVGVFGGAPTTTQQAAVLNSNAVTDTAQSDSVIKSDVVTLDVQMGALASAIAALNNPPTAAQVSAAAASVMSSSAALGNLARKLQNRAINSKTWGGTVPSTQLFADIATHLSNGSSAGGSANANVAANPQQSAVGLKTAQSDLKAARADITIIMQALGIR